MSPVKSIKTELNIKKNRISPSKLVTLPENEDEWPEETEALQ